MAELTNEEIALLNDVLKMITGSSRDSLQKITQQELEMLKSGKYGSRTTFGLPPKVVKVLDKALKGNNSRV